MDASRLASAQEAGCSDDERFALELEFVQCLANPQYLNWLAQTKQLDDPAFVNYLQYLSYWRRPEYARYLHYPHALFFLDLLSSAEFRSAIASNSVADFIHRQQFAFWSHYLSNRMKELPEAGGGPGGTAAVASGGAQQQG